MEEDSVNYTSILVDDGLITMLTNDQLSTQLPDSDIKKVFLEGRTILPGFIDSHSHWIGDRDRLEMTADEVIEAALSSGWTTISEQFVNQDRLAELIQLDSENRLKLRVNAFIPVNYQEQRFGEWYQSYTPHQMVSDKVRIGGVKFFMDNGPKFSNIGRNHWFTPEELNPLVKNAHDLGFQISIHSFIDNATDTALNALDAAQGDNSNGAYRHRIEHASFLRNDQLTRLANMNVIISAQILWHTTEWADTIFADTKEDPTSDLHNLVARWRDVIDNNITFIGSTDTPWMWEFKIGPSIDGLYSLTTRMDATGLSPPQWMLDQRLTIEEALKSITIDAAYGAFEEDVKGSIKEGKLADFVVLSENPMEVHPEKIKDITIDMTIIGGEVVYCAEGLSSMCDGIYQTTLQITSNSSGAASDPSSSTKSGIHLYVPYLLLVIMLKLGRRIAKREKLRTIG